MSSGLPILLVDDNAAHRTLVKRAMVKASINFIVVEAGSLKEARALLFGASPQKFALAILDLNLGDERSTSLIREIRASDTQRLLPILTLSTSALPSDIRESYDNGTDCFLTKANDTSVFTEEIAAATRFLLRA